MNRAMGICRWLYNRYIEANQKLHRMYQRGLLDEHQPRFISAIDFDKYVNNKLKVQPQYAFINKCGSKARKKAIVNAQTALVNFMQGKTSFPRFKRKQEQDATLYFPKNNKADWTVQRHCLRVPTIGWVRLKEYGYLPQHLKIINGTVSCVANRYFVSVTVNMPEPVQPNGVIIGIDFVFAQQMNPHITALKKRLHKASQDLRKKYRLDKQNGSNKFKQYKLLNKINQRMDNIYTDKANKIAAMLTAKMPCCIIFPQSNLHDMRNVKQIDAAYYEYVCRCIGKIKAKLIEKCRMRGIEFRTAENNEEKTPVSIIKIEI